MKIGLYFGSFNPIHSGHLIIANHVLNETDMEKLWFVISPQNPLKNSKGLLNEYHRLHLAVLSTEEDPRIKISDIEFGLPKPSYTVDTLTYLGEKYPEHEFSIIMGSDSFQNIHNWKNFEVITSRYPIYIYSRPGFEIANTHQARITLLTAPLLEISSTQIRKLIKEGKSIRYMTPPKVFDEIMRCSYYKKSY
jgi:nicotinate-nucleotide adenylyltransferase